MRASSAPLRLRGCYNVVLMSAFRLLAVLGHFGEDAVANASERLLRTASLASPRGAVR